MTTRILSDQTQTWTVFELLIKSTICTFLVWYVLYLWGRRNLYKYARKVPGPFTLPFIGYGYKFLGDTADVLEEIQRVTIKYPRICKLWIGSRLYFYVSDPVYYERLLVNELKKDDSYRAFKPLFGAGLFTNNRLDEYKRHRKLIAPTFNQKILDSFIPTFSEQAINLTKELKEFSGKGEFDLFQEVTRCTLDLICETALGVTVNAQTANSAFPGWVDRCLDISFIRVFSICYRYDFLFSLTAMAREEKILLKKIGEFIDVVIRKKKQEFEMRKENGENFDIYQDEGPKRKTFLDYLIEMNSDENVVFTDKELRDEVTTFIIAGSDTTATSMSFAITLFGIYQDLQQKVYEEVMEVLGPDRCVEPGDLPKLKCLEGFIKETLRFFPIAHYFGRELTEDIKVGDYTLPATSSIIVSLLKLHKCEEYFPEPHKFDINRYSSEEAAKRPPSTYMPFSYGPRSCIGQRYAMLAMKSVLATVLRKYKIKSSYEKIEDIRLTSHMLLRPVNGFKVSVEER